MLRSLFFKRLCVGLLCVAVLAMRMGGAHLHLCLDGTVPQATVQVADTGSPPGGLHKLHHDVDISLVGEGFAKKSFDSAPDLPVLVAAVLVLFILRDPTRLLIRREWSFPVRSNPFLRLPPARGPPR